jgi:DNA-binding transcriptional regulator YhcF (GntR family)
MLDLQVSRARPEPLYRQLADAIAWAISTGRVEPGAALPSLRDGEAAWGVNLHTVRRAYVEVEKAGLVRTVPRSGTLVLADSEREPGSNVAPEAGPEVFVARCMAEAERRFGFTAAEFARRAASLVDREPARVAVAECSRTLGSMLAQELRATWLVEATPFVLGAAGATPEQGAIVSTYFHYNEVRQALSDRAADLSFVRMRLSSGFLGRLAQALQSEGVQRVTLLETEESLAHNVKADLVQHFGPDTPIAIRIAGPSGPDSTVGPQALEDGVWILSPQNWDRLGRDLRHRRDVVPLRYEIDPQDLERVGVERGWRRRSHRPGAASTERAGAP